MTQPKKRNTKRNPAHASKLYIAGVVVRDKALMGTKFNRNEEQQCPLCKMYKPFVRKYWVTSIYVVCRRCLYQLESNIKPDKIRRFKPAREDQR